MKRSSRLLLGIGFVLLFAMNAGPDAPSCVPNPEMVPCSTDADCLGAPHMDCKGDFACVDGYCKWTCESTQCSANDDCPPGQYCRFEMQSPDGSNQMTGTCQDNPDGKCAKDADCAKGEKCVLGICPMYVGAPCFGECKPAQHEGCKSDKDCGDGEFCEFPEGQCGGTGKCTKRNETCIELYSPVCGCDNKTYGNACFAEAAGQSIAYKGKCKAPEKCQADKDCPAGQYCDRMTRQGDDGSGSGPSGENYGVCKPNPEGKCVKDADCAKDEKCVLGPCPMCPNCPCFGECQPASPSKCKQDSDCKPGQFCNKDNQCEDYPCIGEGGNGVVYPWSAKCCAGLQSISCAKPGKDGTCEACTGAFFCTKCGDGICKSPENECNCPEDCAKTQGCKSDEDCPDGQYCGFKSSDSDTAPGPGGVCKPIPEGQCLGDSDCPEGEACSKGLCPTCLTPPCPCLGKCLPVNSGCKSNKDCGDGEYCAFPEGQCGGTGQCAKRPRYCYMTVMPVCGCDGKTYTNACFAASAGQTVAYKGKCEESGKCQSDNDCPAGEYCDWMVDEGGDMPGQDYGVCQPNPDGKCVKDGDCKGDAKCVKTRCPECVNCPCFGECQEIGGECSSNADCPKGQYCDGHEECPDCVYANPPCMLPCKYEGKCEALPNGACLDDADCPDGSSCWYEEGGNYGKCTPVPEPE